MTDVGVGGRWVHARLGVTARYVDDELFLDLAPRPETVHHGVVRASVLSFLIDSVAGIQMDGDPGAWSLTTDMTVRMQPVPAPSRVTAVQRVLRQGRRSVVSKVDLTDDAGALVATGAVGFTRVPRKATDPPKPMITPALLLEQFDGFAVLTRPLRDEAGIEAVDPGAGVVEIELAEEVRNPAGTLQGAMVALVAEAAAEDLMATRVDGPVVVTDLDLRYLAKTGAGPVRTRARLLGSGPDATVEVELVDTSTDTLVTLVYARTARLNV
ncbi:MAG: hypothetical protein JWN46_154 [Acidimicrobiales bacterium]|nr:hypothetical protein [Acidimicrobiales bacterium]